MFLLWLQFIIGAVIVIVCGVCLARQGEVLAGKTKLGHIWIGALFLAIITSLPELVVGLAATGLENAPDLAVADVLGSNSFNLFIIAILDLVEGKGALSRRLSPKLKLSGGISLLLLIAVTIAILGKFGLGFFNVGIDSFVLAVICFFGFRLIFRQENCGGGQINPPEDAKVSIPGRKTVSLAKIYLSFFILGALILVAGLWITRSANKIALVSGMEKSFVGALFLAVITSLPELVTCLAAVRLGLFDMALGTIFGSNIFNIMIIFFSDIAYRKGFLLAFVSKQNIWLACLGAILTAIIMIGIIARPKRSFLGLGLDTLLVAVVYVGGIWLIFS